MNKDMKAIRIFYLILTVIAATLNIIYTPGPIKVVIGFALSLNIGDLIASILYEKYRR